MMKTTILTLFALTCCASAGAAEIKLAAEHMDGVTAGAASATAVADAIGDDTATISTFTSTSSGAIPSSPSSPAAGNAAAAALAKVLGRPAPVDGGTPSGGANDDAPQFASSRSSSSVNTNGSLATPLPEVGNLTASQRALQNVGRF